MLSDKHFFRIVFCCLFLSLSFLPLQAAGVLDQSFGTAGSSVVGNGVLNYRIAIQPDNKILVFSAGVGNAVTVRRFTSNGDKDVSFDGDGEKGLWRGFPNSMTLQPDGKILVSGREPLDPTPNPDYGSILCRINADGSDDAGFADAGCLHINRAVGNLSTGFDSIAVMAVQSDGKILAILSKTISGVTSEELLRVNANGTIDTNFASGGYFTNATFSRILFGGVTSDGKIIVGGRGFDSTPEGTTNGRVARLTPSGAIDSSFGQNGFVSIFAGLFSMSIQPDDKIVVSGYTIRRLLTDGSFDSTFGTFYPWSGTLKPLPDGRFLVLTTGQRINLISRTGVLIGRIKPPQANNSQETLSFVDAAAQSDGKIIVGLRNSSGDQPFLVKYNSITSFANKLADYDFDDKTDFGIYRPSNKTFYLQQRSAGFAYQTAATSADVIIPENFVSSFASFPAPDFTSELIWTRADQSYNYFCGDHRISPQSSDSCVQWGLATDVSVGGDYNGDGVSDLTIFRDGLWHIRRSSLSSITTSIYINWGQAGDKPVPADYDADGITDTAIFSPSTGVWWILRSSDASYTAVQFGTAEDKPVPADYDGDGRADFAVYRPSNGVWYLLKSTEGFAAAGFGLSSDKPVPGDYDGDGKTDIAVFRPSDGNWYLLQSKNGFSVVHWGQSGDVPLSTAYAAE